MSKKSLFTEEELIELSKFDNEIDKSFEMSYDDFLYTDFIDKELLFPKVNKTMK